MYLPFNTKYISWNSSPLYYAIKDEHWKSAHKLIDLGVKLEPINQKSGYNILQALTAHYNESLFDRVLPLVDIHWQDHDGETILHHLMEQSKFNTLDVSLEMIKKILKNGADWTIKNDLGQSAEDVMQAYPDLMKEIQKEKSRRERAELKQDTTSISKIGLSRTRM